VKLITHNTYQMLFVGAEIRRLDGKANLTRSSATTEIASDAKRPLKFTQCHPLLCQSTRHTWLPISTQW